jgi:hypothetical protein
MTATEALLAGWTLLLLILAGIALLVARRSHNERHPR